MGEKNIGKTVLGWFVVSDDAHKAEPTAEDLIAKYASEEPAKAAPPPVQLKGDLPKVTSEAPIDFAAVYQAANISPDEQSRIEKATSLLGTLPQETPKETKRQIVEASLRAFGVPVEQIIEAGAQEIQALEAFIRHGENDTQTVLGEATARITKLNQEIESVKELMEAQVAGQNRLTKASNTEKLKIQAVLEFFGQEAVAKVVRDSPKLVEPK